MNIEEKRIKIATACGWENIIYRGILQPHEHDYIGRHDSCIPSGASGDWSGPIPDYFNDLNAMAEAEKHLDSAERERNYTDRLDDGNGGHLATASQRAEAFGLTLGLWKEGERWQDDAEDGGESRNHEHKGDIKIISKEGEWLKCDHCGRVAFWKEHGSCPGINGEHCGRWSDRMDWPTMDEVIAAMLKA